ncbi:Uncharacterised protein [Legionella spiritensis]|nr:Uncharacterised protein [Legionella spiritensis]
MSLAGDQVADERLVLDEDGNIAGTLSIELPDFKPLLSTDDWLSHHVEKNEWTYPSIDTLLRYNFAEKLVAEMLSHNDNARPQHVGLEGLINHSSRGYPYTSIINGYDWLDSFFGNDARNQFVMRADHLSNFPNIPGRTFFPANSSHHGDAGFHPIKGFMASDNIQRLAQNPKTKIAKDKFITFQEQMFYALLKELMVYDPDVWKDNLATYFGDIPLDFMSIPGEKRERLSKEYPELFNPKTNDQPFIDTIARIFQDEYDNIYRTVVFYQGCDKNNSDEPVMSFKEYLQNRLSALHQILAWGEQQGYDRQKLAQRYHQIWRDAHVFEIRKLISACRQLGNNLTNELRRPSASLPPLEQEKFKQLADALLFNEFNLGQSQYSYQYSAKNKIDYLYILKQIEEQTEKYYQLKPHEVTLESNLNFVALLIELIERIEQHQDTDQAEEFITIKKALQCSHRQLCQQQELLEEAIPLAEKDRHDNPQYIPPKPVTQDDINASVQNLFDWAERIEPAALNHAILAIVERDARPVGAFFKANIQNTRTRKIREYLQTSTESGANKLGHILSMDESVNTSPNTYLLRELILLVPPENGVGKDNNLASVVYALKHNNLNLRNYFDSLPDFIRNISRVPSSVISG